MKKSNVIEDVYIRDTKLMVNKIGNEWYKIERAIIHEKSVPIYYQELQPKDPNYHKFNSSDIIGYATNMHVHNDKLLCDVQLNPFNELSQHFMGVIDNYGMSVTNKSHNGKARLSYELKRFIIYDKNKKAEVDKHVQRTNKFAEPKTK